MTERRSKNSKPQSQRILGKIIPSLVIQVIDTILIHLYLRAKGTNIYFAGIAFCRDTTIYSKDDSSHIT